MSSSRTAWVPGLLLAGALSVGLAACGGSKPPSVASVGTTTSSSATGSAKASSSGAAGSGPAQLQQGLLKYAACMRSNGVPNFPDPGAGGGFQISRASGIDSSSPAFKAAQAKCQKYVGGGLAPGTQTHPSPQWLAHMLKVAQCMRRHGISGFPDPRTSVPSNPFGGGTGLISDIDGVILVFPAAIDTQSPLFTRAAQACGFPLHNH